MARLLHRLYIDIYDDGSIKYGKVEVAEEKLPDNVVDLRQVSAQTSTALLVLKYLVDRYTNHNSDQDGKLVFRHELVKAVNDVAVHNNVKVQSVHEKLTRQLGISIVQFRELSAEFLKIYLDGALNNENMQNNLRIKQLLISNIPLKGAYMDSAMIQRFFKNPGSKFIYK